MNTGEEFDDEDVVRCYAYRTDYPEALHACLVDLAPGRARLLDLGCGPGKLARALSSSFDEVLAVDPSAPMLRLGQQLAGGAGMNIRWINARAEDVELDSPVSLAVAGASLHWMDPARVFPKLHRALASDAVLAVINGDGPANAPWIEGWREVIVDWVERTGGVWNDGAHRERITRHEPWFEVIGQKIFTSGVVQAVDELLEAEHSRATWARKKMGGSAAEFDADLRKILRPWATNGHVEFEVRSELTWGRPRAQPSA